MKSLVVLGVLGLIVAFGFWMWLGYEGNRDRGHLIAFAWGNPREGKLELQVVVSGRMVRLKALTPDHPTCIE